MDKTSNQIYATFNIAGIATAYIMLGLSIWLAPVDLSTKGYWGMGIFLLTLSLINFVKYRIDDRLAQEKVQRLEEAKNEKILSDYIAKE